VVAVAANGLVAGAGDHGIHEVFVAAAGGSDAFAGDLLHGAARRHPTVVFALLAALRRLADSRWIGLGGVLLGWFGTGVAVGALSRALGAPRSSWLWAAVATAPAQLALGGAPTLDPLLLPRGVALPVELFALVFLVRARWAPAFALGGLSLLLHAPSGSVVLVGLVAAWLPGRQSRSAPLWALLGAIPAALLAQPALGGLFPPDLWPALQARLAHHLLPLSFPATSWGVAAVWSAAALRSSRGHPLMGRFVFGVLGWALLAGALGPALRVTLLLNLEPWQALRVIVVLGPTLLLASPALTHRSRLLLGAALLALCVWAAPAPWRAAPADVVALGRWAHQSTPPGAIFVLPPDLPPGFRPAAQRPTFGTWKDGGELQFDPDLGREWVRRMGVLCECAPIIEAPVRPEAEVFARSRSGAARLGAAFDARSDADLLRLAAAEGAAYVVRRGPGPGEVVGPFRVLNAPP